MWLNGFSVVFSVGAHRYYQSLINQGLILESKVINKPLVIWNINFDFLTLITAQFRGAKFNINGMIVVVSIQILCKYSANNGVWKIE
jgi:hypothetical protein